MALVFRIQSASSLSSKITSGKFLWSLWSPIHKSTRVDQIDSFTSELVEKKTIKWSRARESILQTDYSSEKQVYKRIDHVAKGISRELDLIRQPDLCVDIRLLSESQLDNIFLGILDEDNSHHFNSIVKQCILYSKLPSAEVLTRCLEYLVSVSQLPMLDAVSEVCEKANEAFYKNNANLLSYKSLALWKGGNVEQSLVAIEDGYQLRSRNRTPLREAFRTIANEAIGTKSEAAMVVIKSTAENVYKNFDEVFLLACVWKSTFGSQWFSDQQLATELFEKYILLRQMVERKATSVCHSLLSRHDIDAVNRLVQLFLKYEGKEACASCLKILFNYQYWRRDLRACSEIMQFCLDIDLALPEIETRKLLDLLLNRRSVLSKPLAKSECSNFQYKF